VIISEDQKLSINSKNDWSIENTDWRDYPQLNQLERACFPPEDIWSFWDVIGILTFPGLVRLKAVVDGRMVGFIGGEPEPARRRGWVTTLGVLPAFRRKGIALALLQRCEHELAMPIIRLSVRASNEAAIGLYEFAGYKISDRWAKYYIGGEDALIFEKHR